MDCFSPIKTIDPYLLQAKITVKALISFIGSSGGAIGGASGGGRPTDSRFVTYGAPEHQVVNCMHNFKNYANILYWQFTSR